MTRPLIGVTVSRRSAWRIFPLMVLNLWLTGGRAVKWKTAADVDLDAVDGVIIGGGDDIAPTLYHGTLQAEARLDHARDAMERWIVERAVEDGIPVFGICRGAQMLNVASGGTLHQDAYAVHGGRRYRTILPRRTVEIAAGSRLGQIVGAGDMRVNALHSQSVDRLGRSLQVSARDGSGMVQAVERTRDPYALGVQWHPEHIFYDRRHRRLFRALVTAAMAYRRDRAQLRDVDAVLEKNVPGHGTSAPAGR
ncbi:Glutamine amidotransferase, class I [Roseibacterium elongatum DSM 19469]|uniref:Glutamine amidotransferase, class I n=1 Tax=Roseicyclus elongatus DSM 19469 TaxID=1294273 RepID=W8SRG2_9RHOB|nr:gamma-glutamyl-gamma-aminobutyrate hydrolase family protein [Roseibacterium elongatum]AHM05125.1 Glutamine amidotransferase, class I [Roseibacterium elongatum DSM 19469]